MQNEFNGVIIAIEKYRPRKPEYIKEKLNLLQKKKIMMEGR